MKFVVNSFHTAEPVPGITLKQKPRCSPGQIVMEAMRGRVPLLRLEELR